MKPDRLDTTTVLIDVGYGGCLNNFEEKFGENVSYKEMEQKSYVEFKEIIFEKINRDIKFRKFGRIGMNLTIKAEMLPKEIEKIKKMLNENQVYLSSNWEVKTITIIKN